MPYPTARLAVFVFVFQNIWPKISPEKKSHFPPFLSLSKAKDPAL